MNFMFSLRPKWSDLKLHSKLLTAFLLIVVVSTLVVTIIVGFFTKMFFNDYVQQIAELRAEQWRASFAAYYIENNNSWDNVQILFNRPSGQAKGFNRGMFGADRIILVDDKGIVVADSFNSLAVGEEAPRLANQLVLPVLVQDKEIGQVLVLGVVPSGGMATLEDRFYKSVVVGTIAAGMVAILLAVILAFLLSRRIAVPLVTLTEAANKLAEKDYHHRISISGSDEIAVLASAFNTMAAAVDKNIQIRNRLMADVAHELRTPVAILRASLECLQAGIIQPTTENIASLHDEVLRLSRLVNDLQEITVAESGNLALYHKKVNFADLVKRVVNNFYGAAATKEIKINLSVPETEEDLNIDEDKIIQVLSNILSNALRYTPEKGSVYVRLQTGSDASAVVEIADTGPGIDPADQPYIFERFYRADSSRSRMDGGAGLGLAIAKSIVEAHGGAIEINCPPEGGTVFRVSLPKIKDLACP